MNKKYWIILIAVAVVSFVLGFMVKFIITGPEIKEVQENEIVVIENESTDVAVRIREGYVEWYDGTAWNRAQSVDALQAEDIYNLAQDDLKAFEESYQITLEAENEAAAATQNDVMSEPLVGSDKRPVTTTTTQVPVSNGNAEQSVVANVPGQSGGTTSSGSTGSSGSGSTTTPSGAGTTSTPSDSGTTSTPSDSGTTSTPSDSGTSTTPSTPSTGDGEDIGWSDDYL